MKGCKDAIQQLEWHVGDKSEAKALMVKAAVPVVPGYHGSDQTTDRCS